MSKVVINFSGGMDSAVLLFQALHRGHDVDCLFFNYGQRHSIELQSAQQLIEHAQQLYGCEIGFDVLDVQFIRQIANTSSLTNDNIATPNVKDMRGEAQPASYVPNRNMMFLSMAASKAEAAKGDFVWYGATKVDSLAGYWDTDKSFIENINNLLSLNRDHRVTVQAPLISMDKKDIVEKGIELQVPFSKTYTCYSGQKLADPSSASSSMRIQGFISAGYADPIVYQNQERLTEIYKQKNCRLIDYDTYQWSY